MSSFLVCEITDSVVWVQKSRPAALGHAGGQRYQAVEKTLLGGVFRRGKLRMPLYCE
jgi:uncharacterized membrane protein